MNDMVPRSATDMAAAIEAGEVKPTALLAACLWQIDRLEPEIRAWAHLDRTFAMEQARAADARQASGKRLSRLDGVPFGVKDNIDTSDFPTEMGSPIHKGRRPDKDAWIVAAMRDLGMVLVGKTVTTPFGMNAPAPTLNPVDPNRTLGASSVGSAAAVAAGMVPLTVNTQNTSSTTRPAAYAGVFAFKPTHDLIPLDGCLALCPPTATVAFMAKELDDFSVLVETLGQKLPFPASAVFKLQQDPAPDDLARCAIVRGPWWPLAETEALRVFEDFAAAIPIDRTIELPARFADAISAHCDLIAGDMAVTINNEHSYHRTALPEEAVSFIKAGKTLPSTRYVEAMRLRHQLAADLEDRMADIDVLVTLSTTGAPPLLKDGLGDGTFSMPWTFCGLPTLSLPLLETIDGMPISVQLIGRHNQDMDLLEMGRSLLIAAASTKSG